MGKVMVPMKVKKAVIPAAGFGTRFLPITKVVPKELLPVRNKPSIQYVVEEAVASGVEEIIFVCHPSKKAVVDYFRPDIKLKDFLQKKGKKKEIEELERIESLARFRVAIQEEPLGLGHAILCAEDLVGRDRFFVSLPDVLVVSEIPACRQLLEACPSDEDWGVLLERVGREMLSSYGIVRCGALSNETCRVQGAVEKPNPSEAPSDLAILGRYLFTPEIFSEIKGQRTGALGEIQLSDAINNLCRKHEAKGAVCRGRVLDVGTPEGLKAALEFLK